MTLPITNATLISQIKHGHEIVGKQASKTGCITALAVFILISSLIVITCASLCISIHGVRLIEDIVIPAYLPAGAGLLFSIPLIVSSVRQTKHLTQAHKTEVMDKVAKIFKSDELVKLAAKEKSRYDDEKADY